MSVIALHDLQDFEISHAQPRRRDHLRVVQPGERVTSAVEAPGRLTLTRRGRLTITITVATVLVMTVVAALGVLSAAAAPVATDTIVVQPGQTLSQIAVTELPGMPMDQAIVEIQLANELNTLQVQAGMELEIPRP